MTSNNTPASANGNACQTDDVCTARGFVCTSKFMCEVAAGLGQVCTDNSDCLRTLSCISGVCVEGQKTQDNGSPCDVDEQCTSGTCFGGVCTASAEAPAPRFYAATGNQTNSSPNNANLRLGLGVGLVLGILLLALILVVVLSRRAAK